MGKIIFGHDENLGFPLNDPQWAAFFKRFQVEQVPYKDMGTLTKDLEAHQLAISYLPAGNQYYIRKHPFYSGVASALIAEDGKTTFRSVLVVRHDSPIESWTQLDGKKLGIIHRFCTSSYFGPAIFLSEKGACISDFFSRLVQVPPWQAQIDAVVAKEVDATMVMECAWKALPKNKETTRIIGYLDGLPTPSIIASKNADPFFLNELRKNLLKKVSISKNALFSGFAAYQAHQIDHFFTLAEHAKV